MSDDTAIVPPPRELRLHDSVAMLLAFDAERSLNAAQRLEEAALSLLDLDEDGELKAKAAKDIASIAASLKTSQQLRAAAAETLLKAQERDLAERLRGNRSGLDVRSPQVQRMAERARRMRVEAQRFLDSVGDDGDGDVDAAGISPTEADVA